MDKKYTITGSIGLILTVIVIAGLALNTADYRQMLADNPDSNYVMISYGDNSKLEFITRGLSDFLRWKITEDETTIYDASSIAAKSDWSVEYYRTYGEDKWVKLRRKISKINFNYTSDAESITALKNTPYYKYYSSGNGGEFSEEFKVTGTAHYTDFPDLYSVTWTPDDSRSNYLHRLTWRVRELEPLENTPTGILRDVYEMSFGHHMKVSWKDSAASFDYAEYNTDTEILLVHFNPVQGTQNLLVKAFDPTPTTTLVYLDNRTDRRYYEQGHNATIYAEVFESNHSEVYSNVPLENTDIKWWTIRNQTQRRTSITIPDNVYNCTAQFVLGFNNEATGNLSLSVGSYSNSSVLISTDVSANNEQYNITITNEDFINDTSLNVTFSCPDCTSGSLDGYWLSSNDTAAGGNSWYSSNAGSTWTLKTGEDFIVALSCTKKESINATIYLSADHPVYGDNFTSGDSPLTFVWEDINSSLQTFSDGNSTKYVTANGSLTYSAHSYDQIDSAYFSIYAVSEVTDLEIYSTNDSVVDYTAPKVREDEVVFDGDYFSDTNVSVYTEDGSNSTTISINGNKTYVTGKINITAQNYTAAIIQTISVAQDDLFSLAASSGNLYAGQIRNLSDSTNSNVYTYREYDGKLLKTSQVCLSGGCTGIGAEGSNLYLYYNGTASYTIGLVYKVYQYNLGYIDLSIPNFGTDYTGRPENAQGMCMESNNSYWAGGYDSGKFNENLDTIISSNTELYGTHYYNSFQITSGATVTIADKNATDGTGYLKIYAKENITMCASCSINGSGAGYAGGAGGDPGGDDGDAGAGPQAGAGGIGGGGGAGGYGDGRVGANHDPTEYDGGGASGSGLFNFDWYIGSGGGGGEGEEPDVGHYYGGDGGNGGASLLLSSENVWIYGNISLAGNKGGSTAGINNPGGGGGGSGGHLRIFAETLVMNVSSRYNLNGGDSGTAGGWFGGSGSGGSFYSVCKICTVPSSWNLLTDCTLNASACAGVVPVYAPPVATADSGNSSETTSDSAGYSGAAIWNFYWNGTQITKYNAESTPAIFNSTMDIQGQAYDSDNSYVWIADANHGMLWAMNTTGSEISTASFDSPVTNMRGLSWYNGYLYVLNGTAIYKVARSGNPDHVLVDIGNDGVWDYNQTGVGEATFQVDNLTAIQNYVDASCTTTTCNLPIKIQSNTSGVYTVKLGTVSTDALISHELEAIDLNVTAIQDYLDLFSPQSVTYPIVFNASSWGNLTVNTTLIYYNGTSNYTITAQYYGNATYDASSDSNNATVVFSGYNITFAQDYIEFIPKSPTQKNVTPYGQSDTVPIMNLTSYGYEMSFNLTMNTNETYSCVNDTISTTSTEADGIQLNVTYQTLSTGVSVDESVGLWATADYGCNFTTWKLWQPLWDIKACCRDCVCQEA